MEKKEREIKKERSGFWFVSRVNEMNDSVASWLDTAAARVTQGCSCVERGALAMRCDVANWSYKIDNNESGCARRTFGRLVTKSLHRSPPLRAAGNLILMRRK